MGCLEVLEYITQKTVVLEVLGCQILVTIHIQRKVFVNFIKKLFLRIFGYITLENIGLEILSCQVFSIASTIYTPYFSPLISP